MLSEDEKDVLCEVVNIGIGRAAGSLNQLLDSHIELTVPRVIVADQDGCLPELLPLFQDQWLSSVRMGFSGPVKGQAYLCFPEDSANKLSSFLSRSEGTGLIEDGVLAEVGNIVINAVLGEMANLLNLSFDYELPNLLRMEWGGLLKESNGHFVLAVEVSFRVRELDVSGALVLMIQLGDLERFRKALRLALA